MSEKALVQQPASSGLIEMDFGSASEMARRLQDMQQKLTLVQQFFQKVMVPNVDYGVIPGTNKPTLLKPGAEKLCELYNFAPVVKEKVETRDFNTGYYQADVVIQLVHRGTGVVVAEGVGTANAYESRYRYRWVYESELPRGVDKDSMVVKEREGRSGRPYKMYRIDNDDLFSLWNTVLKMAKKRALVDAVLSATRSSGIFAQPEEELEAWLHGEDPESVGEEEAQGVPQRNGNPQRQPQASRAGSQNTGPKNPNAPASEAQLKAIFAIGKKKNLSQDDVKHLIRNAIQREDIGTMTMGEASNLIELLQNTETADLLAMIAPPVSDDDLPPDLLGGVAR